MQRQYDPFFGTGHSLAGTANRSMSTLAVPRDWPELFSYEKEFGSGATQELVVAEFPHHPDGEPAFLNEQIVRWRAGWPWVCFELSRHHTELMGGAVDPVGQWGTWVPPDSVWSTLPVVPRFPELIWAWLLYGSIAWALLCGPLIATRMYRRRHGLCTGCGYDLAELDVCPECGESIRTESPRVPA